MPSWPSPHGVKLAAAWLIELCGWKGRIEGWVGVHSGQPLVLVNLGGATGGEILALARTIQDDVERKTGVRLEIEVNIL
jgi:UDP-N-acetylmuramate dehydrogenase